MSIYPLQTAGGGELLLLVLTYAKFIVAFTPKPPQPQKKKKKVTDLHLGEEADNYLPGYCASFGLS